MNKGLSALVGAIISIMICFNGELASHLGNYLSTIIIHIVGLLTILILLKAKKEKFNLSKNIPLYLYTGGIIGLFTLLFTNISFKYLGISITLALGLLGQSLASIIIDHYGLSGITRVKFNTKKVIGFLIMTSGIIIMTFF